MFDNYVEQITDEIKVLNESVLDLKDYLIEQNEVEEIENNSEILEQNELIFDENFEEIEEIEESFQELFSLNTVDNTDLLEEILLEEQKQSQYLIDQFNYIHDFSIVLIVVIISGFGLLSLFKEWTKW